MSFEKHTSIYEGEPQGTTVRPGKRTNDFSFSFAKQEGKRYRLFTTGETAQFYLWKDEPDCPRLYYMLTDALDTRHAIKDRFCLSLSCKKPEAFIKRVYKKLLWTPVLSYLKMNPVPTAWNMGITVSAKNLTVKENGYLRMRLDIRLKKEGVSPHSVAEKADDTYTIDIPAGSYKGHTLSLPVEIPENTAHIGVFIEGVGYKGECYVEAPFLTADGQNLLPAFNEAVQDRTHLDWAAQYLSRKEWPTFKVRLNGEIIFSGEVFERCHRHSEWEIPLPYHLLKEENTLSYELTSSYHDPLPYTIYEIGIVEQPDEVLSLLSVSEAVHAGGKARVLLRTARPGLRVTLTPQTDALSGKKEWFFREKGLHGMLIDCLSPCEDALFSLSWEGGETRGCVKRIVRGDDDGVITGTGDMIYIAQEDDAMEEYLAWYLSNHVGDLITIRPTYRWSGTRTLNTAIWKKFGRLMRELDMKYVLMADGREPPGLSTQPDESLLKGKGFLGIQLHERDGAQFYWFLRKTVSFFEEQCTDLEQFAYDEAPRYTAPHHSSASFVHDGDTTYLHGDRRSFDDRRLEHEKAVSMLARVRGTRAHRHTGPSAMFKYIHEAGYEWLGAETMYQTMEPILGFLRGLAKDRAMPSFGVHHAVQWSTSPHDSPARYRRFRLALYASYIEGATEINTEEGLWHLEEYYAHFHRFDEACRRHLKEQQDFYRYTSTHTRSGSFYTPIALLHGRDDGTTFFSRDNAWGHSGEPHTPAEDSWSLITAVYPKAIPMNCIFVHGCVEDKPLGFHSGTPFGCVDMTPAEGEPSTWKSYRSLIFLGYHRFEEGDAEKLLSYVRAGGNLLLTDAHLTESTTFTDTRTGALTIKASPMAMCEGEPRFVPDTLGGKSLSVCANPTTPDEVLLRTDSGRPLVCVYRVGKGRITLFHTKEYPAHPAIAGAYRAAMMCLCEESTACETVWAKVGDDIVFTAYDQEDASRHIYFLAVDWFRDPAPAREASLRLSDTEYRFPVPFGILLKCVCRQDTAVMCETEAGEVLSVEKTCATVQGTGKVPFRIFKDGTQRVFTVDFSDATVKHIVL